MTLERAIEVLNERQHRGHAKWYLDFGGSGDYAWRGAVGPDPHDDALDEFEAIAIAEKYERDSPEST